jgi:ribosomal protein S18 acetylase RimI-like enzyme
MDVSLRPVREDDADFLYRLYASTRQAEMAAWGWDKAQQNFFIQMQFRAQRMGYASEFPDAEHRVILVDDEPAGRVIVHRAKEAMRLVDIAVLTEYRNRGVGTRVIRDLTVEAGACNQALLLQVSKGNPAIHLYQRLGFVTNGEDELFHKMLWEPASKRA